MSVFAKCRHAFEYLPISSVLFLLMCFFAPFSNTRAPPVLHSKPHLSERDSSCHCVQSIWNEYQGSVVFKNTIIKESACTCYTNLHISHCFDEDPFEGKERDTGGIFFMNMHLQTNTQFYIVPCYIMCFCTPNAFPCYSKNR